MAKRSKAADLTPNKDTLAAMRSDLIAYRAREPRKDAQGVLGIDPGTVNIALCYMLAGEAVTSKIELPRFPVIADTVRYVEQVVENWVVQYQPELLVKEGPAHFARFGIADSGRVQYAIERVAFEHRVPLITLAPQTMRSFLGTAGKNHTKSDTKLALYKRYGVEFETEDEADAYGLSRCGLAIASGEFELSSVRQARIKKEKATK